MTRRPLPDHGTISRYKYHRCRCLTCCNGWRDYSRNVRRQQAYGRWDALVDPAPTLAHIQELRASGLGIHRIAHLSGVAQSTISRLLYGKNGLPPQARIRRPVADAILAVRADPTLLADGAMIDATGTRRRICALIAVGWTHKALAPHLGVNPAYVGDLAVNRHITARHARAVAEAYDRLWNADPAAHGVSPASAKRSRNLAARQGWAPPAAWDDDTIDNPKAKPDTGARAGLTRDDLAALRREEIAHLSGFGVSAEEIATRLGMGVSTVTGVLRELGAAA